MKKRNRNRTAAPSCTTEHSCSTGLGEAGASGWREGVKNGAQPQASKMALPHAPPPTEHNSRQVSVPSSSVPARRILLEGRWTLRLRDPITGRSVRTQQKCATARGISRCLSETADSTSLPTTHWIRRHSEENKTVAESSKLRISSQYKNSHGRGYEGDVLGTVRQAKDPTSEASGVLSLGPGICTTSTSLQLDSRQPAGDICFPSSLAIKEDTSNSLQLNTNIVAGSVESIKCEPSQTASSDKVSKMPSPSHGSDNCQRKGTTTLRMLVSPELPISSVEMASYHSSVSPLITRNVQRLSTTVMNPMKRRLLDSPPFSTSSCEGENQRLSLSQPVNQFKGFSSSAISNRQSVINQFKLHEMQKQKELNHCHSEALSRPCSQGDNTGFLSSPSVLVQKVYHSVNDSSSHTVSEKRRNTSNSNILKDPDETNTPQGVNKFVSLSQPHGKFEMPEEHRHAKHKASLNPLVTISPLPMSTTPPGPLKNNSTPTAHSNISVTPAGPCRRDTKPADPYKTNTTLAVTSGSHVKPAEPPRGTMVSNGPHWTNTTQPGPSKNQNQITPAKPTKNKSVVPVVPGVVQNTPAVILVEPSTNQNTTPRPSMNQNIKVRPPMNQNSPTKHAMNQNATTRLSTNQNTPVTSSTNHNSTSTEPFRNHNKPNGPFNSQNTSAGSSVNQIRPDGYFKKITPAGYSKNQIILGESSMSHNKTEKENYSKIQNTPAGPPVNQNAPPQPSRKHNTHELTELTQKDTGLAANSPYAEACGGLSNQFVRSSKHSKEVMPGMPVKVVVKRLRKKTLTKMSVLSSIDARELVSVKTVRSVTSMNYVKPDSEPIVPVKSSTDLTTPPPPSSMALAATSKELVQPCSMLNQPSPAMPLLQPSLAEYSVRPEVLSMPPLKPVTSAKPSMVHVTPTTSLGNILSLCSTSNKSSPTIPILQSPVGVGHSVRLEMQPMHLPKPAKPSVTSQTPHTFSSQNPQTMNSIATEGLTVTGLQRKTNHSSNSTAAMEMISSQPQSGDKTNSKTLNELEGKIIYSSPMAHPVTTATLLQMERKASSKYLPVTLSPPLSCTSEELHPVTCPPQRQDHSAAVYRTKLHPASLEFLPGIRENCKGVKEGQNYNTSEKEELSGRVSQKMLQDKHHNATPMRKKERTNMTLPVNTKASCKVPPNAQKQKATLQEGCEMREEDAPISQRMSEQQSSVRKRKHSCGPESSGLGSLPTSHHTTSLEHKSLPKRKRSRNRNISRKDNKNNNTIQDKNGSLLVNARESQGVFVPLQRSCTIQQTSAPPQYKKDCKVGNEKHLELKEKDSGETREEAITEADMKFSQSQHHSPLMKQVTPTPSIPGSPELHDSAGTMGEMRTRHRGIVLSPKVVIVRINDKVIKNATKKAEEAELKKAKPRKAARKRNVRVRNAGKLATKKTKAECMQGSSEKKPGLSASNTSSIPYTASHNGPKTTTEKDPNVHESKNKNYALDDKGIFISQKLEAEAPYKLPTQPSLGLSIKRKASNTKVVDTLFKKLQLDKETTQSTASLASQTSGDIKLATPPPPSQPMELEHPTPGNIITYLPRLSQALKSLPMSSSKIIKNQNHLPDTSSLRKPHNYSTSVEATTNKSCNPPTEGDRKVVDKEPQPSSCQPVSSEKDKDLEDFDMRKKAVISTGVRKRNRKNEVCRGKEGRVNKVEGKEEKEQCHQMKQGEDGKVKKPNKQPPQEGKVDEKHRQQMEGGVNVKLNLMDETVVKKQSQQVEEVNEKQNKVKGRRTRKQNQRKVNIDERQKQVEVQMASKQCQQVEEIVDEKQGQKVEERGIKKQNKQKPQRGRSDNKERQQAEAKVDGKQAQVEGKLNCKQRQMRGKVDGKQSEVEERMDSKQRQMEAKVDGKQSQVEGKLNCKQRQMGGKVDGKQGQVEGRLDSKQRQIDGKQGQVEGRLDGKRRGRVVKKQSKEGETCPSVQRETRSMNNDSQIHNSQTNTSKRRRRQNIPEKRKEELEETSQRSKRTQFDHSNITSSNSHLPSQTLHTNLTQPYTGHPYTGTVPRQRDSVYTPVCHIQTHMNVNPNANSNLEHALMNGPHMYANTPLGHVNLPYAYINTPHIPMNTHYTHNPYIHMSETCANTSLTYSHIRTPRIYLGTPAAHHIQRGHTPAYRNTPNIHMNTPNMYKDQQYTHKATNVRYTPSLIHNSSAHIQKSTASMDMRTPYKYTYPCDTPSTVCPTPSGMQAKIDKYRLHSYRLLRARLLTART